MKILGLLIGCFAVAAFGDSVFVEDGPPELVELMKLAIPRTGHRLAKEPGGADYGLRGSLLKLGSARIVTIEKKKGDRVVYRTQLKSREAEELDEVVLRVVRAALEEADAYKDARVGDVVLDEETRGTRRKGARMGQIASINLAFLGNLGTRSLAFFSFSGGWAAWSGNFQVAWRLGFTIDLEDLILDTTFLRRSYPTALFLDTGASLTWYPLDGDLSPFLTGEFGWGLARHARLRSTVGGVMVGGIAGLAFALTGKGPGQVGVRFATLLESALPKPPQFLGIYLGGAF